MIQPISTLSFKAIYKNPDVTFSQKQNFISDNIITSLQTPDKKGITLENYLEERDYDFYLDAEKGNTVSLSLLKGLRYGVGIDNEDDVYENKLHIGTYSEKHLFKISDVKTKMIEEIKDATWKCLMAVGFVVALFTLMPKSCNRINANSTIDNVINKSTDIRIASNHQPFIAKFFK